MTDALTHDQALALLMDHVGEHVGVNLCTQIRLFEKAFNINVMQMEGTLGHARIEDGSNLIGPTDSKNDPDMPALNDIIAYVFTVDGKPLVLPPLPGTVEEEALGIEFRLGDGLTLQISWEANSEQ